MGAIAGVILALNVFVVLTMGLGVFMMLDAPFSDMDALGLVIYGQLLKVPIGAAIGIGVALGLAKREGAVLTAFISIPVSAAVMACVWWLIQVSDTMDFGWLLIIPPLPIPFLSRWIARAVPSKSH